MDQASSEFFSEVQRNLDEMGQSTVLTVDERDIVDDYAQQEFSAKECAVHISKQRI